MYQLDKPDNLVDLFEGSVSRHSRNPLFGTKGPDGEYRWSTYAEVARRVDNLRGGLASLGIAAGDAVGIIANNREEWAVIAFAAYGLGARYVPMYEAELIHIWKYIITDSALKILFVSKPEIYEKIRNFEKEIPTLERVFIIEGEGGETMENLEKVGEANPVPSIHPDAGDIAVLIYTSGTTGEPKGVLLSHGNFTSNALAATKLYPEFGENDRTLPILPWAHSYGQTADLYSFIHLGASMGLAENVNTIAEDLGKVKPTFLIAVPRIFNRVYDALWAKMNEEGGLAKKLFVMGVESAKKRRELAANGKSNALVNAKFAIADTLVFSKIRKRFGGRLKGALTASAVMNIEIAHFFCDIGIPTYDCYGLTETSPAVTINSPSENRLGSVGKAIDKVRVVIDKSLGDPEKDDGEIIVYGPNVMKGYHNKLEETEKVMTPDGGFRTGDRGRLDDDGFLYITGRIKEQFKLENGKFVFPASLEEDIKLVPFVEQAMIFGEGRAYTVALIVPDFTVLEKYARERGLPGSQAEMIANEEIQEIIGDAVTKSLEGKYGHYEIPKKFLYLKEGFSLENGTLTQTMKLKRRIVLEKYGNEIEALYGQ
ncbi:MAG: long-chain fatty acid--CoA ligase [Syntrophales bacterium]|nr:long-chain fatty acid--CoA ligase [Syntrophales bacterium]